MIMGDMKHLDAYKAQMPDFIYEVLKEAPSLILQAFLMENIKSKDAI